MTTSEIGTLNKVETKEASRESESLEKDTSEENLILEKRDKKEWFSKKDLLSKGD